MSYRKTAAGLIVAFLILAFSGCGSAEAETMTGTWKGGPFVAHIQKNKVTMYIVNDGSAFLYWSGDFVRRDQTFFSKANTKLLSNSVMGSEDKHKIFVFSNDRLRFTFSMLGQTRRIALKKVA